MERFIRQSDFPAQMGDYFKLVQNAQGFFTPKALESLENIANYDHENGVYNINGQNKMVGKSLAMVTVFYLTENALNKDSNVLILGETGTGKELIARALHYNSFRYTPTKQNFIVVNCGYPNRDMLSSELFGYSKGAFTGANPMGKMGAFEKVEGVGNGTLVLDEIGDMPLEVQATLLRVLQEKKFKRLGDVAEISVPTTRIIASTNKDLLELVNQGQFREDLYHRLDRLSIYLPPLRERDDEDIKSIIKSLTGQTNLVISQETLSTLKKTGFPGNVRGLENLVTKAKEYGLGEISNEFLAAMAPYMQALSLTLNGNGGKGSYKSGGDPIHITPSTLNIKELTKYAIEEALRRTPDNLSATSRLTGMSREALRKYRDPLAIEAK